MSYFVYYGNPTSTSTLTKEQALSVLQAKNVAHIFGNTYKTGVTWGEAFDNDLIGVATFRKFRNPVEYPWTQIIENIDFRVNTRGTEDGRACFVVNTIAINNEGEDVSEVLTIDLHRGATEISVTALAQQNKTAPTFYWRQHVVYDWDDGRHTDDYNVRTLSTIAIMDESAHYNASGTYIERASWSCGVPVFWTLTDAQHYLNTGEINEGSVIQDELPVISELSEYTFYYDYKSGIIENNNKFNIETNEVIEFKLLSQSDKIALIRDDANHYTLSHNMDYVLINFTTDSEGNYNGERMSVNDLIHNFIDGDFIEPNTGKHLKGVLNTNIPIIDDWSEYDPNNIIDHLTIDPIENATGENGIMGLSELETNMSMVSPYYITANELGQIEKILYYNDVDFMESLKNGLYLYADNPISCVVDCYFTPFDLSDFVNAHSNARLKFGSFEYNGEVPSATQTHYNKVVSCSGVKECVNTEILTTYNDFRDYEMNYKLYLPYYGIIDLPSDCVGRVLKVNAQFDIYSAQLKYYIYLDNALITSVETATGRHIAVTGNDWINKANKVIGSTLGVGANLLGEVVSVPIGNVGGVVSNGVSAIQNIIDVNKKPSTTIANANTSGMNIFDDMQFYLILESYETLKPSALNKVYNYPSYYLGYTNKLKGYCELSDIKIDGRLGIITDSELAQFKEECKRGIIL